MNTKNIDFDGKKIKKRLLQKKKAFWIDNIDVNKVLSLKKNHMVKIIHLYTLLDIIIIMLLDHYV